MPLFCTIDLTFENLFSVFSAFRWCRQAHLFFSQEGKAGAIWELNGSTIADAASFQPIALQTGAPGFYTTVKLRH